MEQIKRKHQSHSHSRLLFLDGKGSGQYFRFKQQFGLVKTTKHQHTYTKAVHLINLHSIWYYIPCVLFNIKGILEDHHAKWDIILELFIFQGKELLCYVLHEKRRCWAMLWSCFCAGVVKDCLFLIVRLRSMSKIVMEMHSSHLQICLRARENTFWSCLLPVPETLQQTSQIWLPGKGEKALHKQLTKQKTVPRIVLCGAGAMMPLDHQHLWLKWEQLIWTIDC